jgi:hypothetical protein
MWVGGHGTLSRAESLLFLDTAAPGSSHIKSEGSITQLSLVSRGNEYYLPGSVETLVPLFAETLQRVQDLIGEFETPLILELHLNLWHRITWPVYTLLPSDFVMDYLSLLLPLSGP